VRFSSATAGKRVRGQVVFCDGLEAEREALMSEEEIAARHFVMPAVVKQRLRLASVSNKLHEIYAEDGMTLEQLMAFSVTADHARHEQVWEQVSRSGYDEPYQIRRLLTEQTVRASDRRARFVSLETYEQAGGGVMRDLFEHDDGGYLQDVALLDRLVTDKLKLEAEKIATEGWKWLSVAVDFPYGHTSGLRELAGKAVDLTPEEQATIDALNAEQAKLESDYQDADDLPDEVDQRRRDRSGTGRVRRPIDDLRAGRDRPRWRIRQHRFRRTSLGGPGLRPGRGRRLRGRSCCRAERRYTTDRGEGSWCFRPAHGHRGRRYRC
jgi:ParB-like chromosome segregation protein Spo0J